MENGLKWKLSMELMMVVTYGPRKVVTVEMERCFGLDSVGLSDRWEMKVEKMKRVKNDFPVINSKYLNK